MKSPFSPLLSWLLVFLVAFTPCGPTLAADVSITAGNVVPGSSAQYRYGTAGAAITAGQLVYLDAATNTWKLTDANASDTAADVDGIAVNSAASGAPVTIVTRDDDLTLGGTTAKGTIYIASATAGGIAPATDLVSTWYLSVVAIGKSTTKVVFDADGLRNRVAQ